MPKKQDDWAKLHVQLDKIGITAVAFLYNNDIHFLYRDRQQLHHLLYQADNIWQTHQEMIKMDLINKVETMFKGEPPKKEKPRADNYMG